MFFTLSTKKDSRGLIQSFSLFYCLSFNFVTLGQRRVCFCGQVKAREIILCNVLKDSLLQNSCKLFVNCFSTPLIKCEFFVNSFSWCFDGKIPTFAATKHFTTKNNNDMKKNIITMLLLAAAMTLHAQDKLFLPDSLHDAVRRSAPDLYFHDQEMLRLLMPKNAEFGVECVPSFECEWTLTYSPSAHALIYKVSQGTSGTINTTSTTGTITPTSPVRSVPNATSRPRSTPTSSPLPTTKQNFCVPSGETPSDKPSTRKRWKS